LPDGGFPGHIPHVFNEHSHLFRHIYLLCALKLVDCILMYMVCGFHPARCDKELFYSTFSTSCQPSYPTTPLSSSNTGWPAFDIWEQRLFLWAIFSIISFTHFILSDPNFVGWSSVYFYCGHEMQYCTASYRWNLRGWRKATALWNFCLSTALAFQRLGVEAGLGGLLPGEEVVTRESFISIGWRLIPFWLNRWESNFGAECSSILFELPHFALELLVVLPLVQIICGRLRILGQPHVRAAEGGAVRQGPRLGDNEDEDEMHVPNVLMCAWVRDSSQRKLMPRLKANVRVMATIVMVSGVAAMNALIVPLGLEQQAAFTARADPILNFADELAMLVDVGNNADKTHWYIHQLASKSHSEDEEEKRSVAATADVALYSSAFQCIERSNCTNSLQAGLVTALKDSGAIKQNQSFLAGVFGVLADMEINSTAVHVPEHWLIPLLDAMGNGDMKDLSSISVDRMAALLLPPSEDHRLEKTIGVEALRHIQRVYLKKVAELGWKSHFPDALVGASMPGLYHNLHKHAGELRRMRDPEHRAMVPLVEIALTIMRLSCERWFALVGVYVGYLLFVDPPPLARAAIRGVAQVSRIFQRGILMSFPAVCWAYGAGMVFSSFASVIFWTGPLLRAVERLRSVATEVKPRDWHQATSQEIERMGDACAICWGALQERGNGEQERGEAMAAMGLPCGHAYHHKCLLEWLQACYGQSRKPICPMCQLEVPLQIRYRVPLPRGGDGDALQQHGGENLGDAGRGGGGLAAPGVGVEGPPGLHRREGGIPGLDALVDDLRDEFQHRFEQPIGPLHFVREPEEREEGEALPQPPPARDLHRAHGADDQAIDGARQDAIELEHPRRGIFPRIFRRRGAL